MIFQNVEDQFSVIREFKFFEYPAPVSAYSTYTYGEFLTDLGAQVIFDEWERMRISVDISVPAASDEDIALLAHLAKRLPVLGKESRARELRCRRLLRFVLEELETVNDPPASDRSDAAPAGA